MIYAVKLTIKSVCAKVGKVVTGGIEVLLNRTYFGILEDKNFNWRISFKKCSPVSCLVHTRFAAFGKGMQLTSGLPMLKPNKISNLTSLFLVYLPPHDDKQPKLNLI